jgi:hypothetical protein
VPVCAAKVRQARAEEIDAGLRRHLARGGGAFATFTIPHDAGMAFADLWSAMAETWSVLLSGRHRQGLRKLGVIGTIRAVDVTHGRNGWHPHLHVLLPLEARPEIEDLQAIHRFLRERWNRRVLALGFREPSLYRGVRLLPVMVADEVGAYLTKVGEVDDARPRTRPNRPQDRPRLGLALTVRHPAGHHRLGRAADWRLFEEWLLVSKGRRTLEWSRGLRAGLLADVAERTDEQIAGETDSGTPVVTLAPSAWREVVAGGLSVAVLRAADAGGCRGGGDGP